MSLSRSRTALRRLLAALGLLGVAWLLALAVWGPAPATRAAVLPPASMPAAPSHCRPVCFTPPTTPPPTSISLPPPTPTPVPATPPSTPTPVPTPSATGTIPLPTLPLVVPTPSLLPSPTTASITPVTLTTPGNGHGGGADLTGPFLVVMGTLLLIGSTAMVLLVILK